MDVHLAYSLQHLTADLTERYTIVVTRGLQFDFPFGTLIIAVNFHRGEGVLLRTSEFGSHDSQATARFATVPEVDSTDYCQWL